MPPRLDVAFSTHDPCWVFGSPDTGGAPVPREKRLCGRLARSITVPGHGGGGALGGSGGGFARDVFARGAARPRARGRAGHEPDERAAGGAAAAADYRHPPCLGRACPAGRGPRPAAGDRLQPLDRAGPVRAVAATAADPPTERPRRRVMPTGSPTHGGTRDRANQVSSDRAGARASAAARWGGGSTEVGAESE